MIQIRHIFAGAKGNTTKLNQPTMTTAFGGGPAPFSFHCIICFEAFNLEDRPPVILPCGHTYVCAPCSKRLDKCMECRTSLFIKPDDVRRNSAGHGTADGGFAASGSGAAAASAADTESMPSWYRPLPGRAHSRDATYQLKSTSPHTQAQRKQANPAKAAEPIPLPMPKNLVMMALMEAAEEKKRLEKISNRVKAKAAAERNEKRPANDGKDRPPETVSIAAAGLEGIEKTDESFQKVVEDGSDTSENDYYEDDDDESSKAYESGDDDSAVKVGIRSLLGTCGTYVVKDEAGLCVLTHHPFRTSSSGATGLPLPPNLTSSSPKSSSKSNVRFEEAEPLHISRGQTVQISYIDENGVAVLARGCGFIPADEDQLVKVGAPRDRACQIEGTLRSIESKKQWYSRRLAELPLLEQKYAMDLDAVMREGSDGQYPVIGPPPQQTVTEDGKDEDHDSIFHGTTAEVDESGNVETSPKPALVPPPSHDDQPPHISPVRQAAETTPQTPNPTSVSPGTKFADCSPYTIDNSEIGPFVLSDDSDDMRQLQYQPPTLIPQPLQRQDSNNIVSNLSLGCGFLAANSYLDNQEEDSLVGLSFDSAIDLDRSAHSPPQQNAQSPDRNRPPEYPRTPDRSYAGLGGRGAGSFDTLETSSSRVDFRSGYSGHRGVMGAKSHADRMREKARRDFRSMGEHRGIATVSSRLSASSSGSQQQQGGGQHSVTPRSDRKQVSRISDAR